MYLIFLPLIIFTLNATEINLAYKRETSVIKISSDAIIYNDQNTDLSVKKIKCNEHVLKKALKIIELNLSKEFPEKENKESLELIIDGQKKYESLKTKRGQFFYRFSDYIKYLKIESDLNCNPH